MDSSTVNETVSMTPPTKSPSESTTPTLPLEFTNANRFVDTSALVPDGWPRKVYQFFRPMVEYAFGFPDLWRLHAASIYPPFEPVEIARRAFKQLEVSWDIQDSDLQKLASIRGPLILVANHPFGGIDSLALAQLLELMRPGQWRFLSNIMVSSLPGLEERFIPLDPLGENAEARRINKVGLHAANKHLRQGGLLGLFPGGRVSHRHKRFGGNVADRPWSEHFLRQARRTGATIACIYIPGHNSRTFLKVPARWPKIRALFLCRELTRPPVAKVTLQLAAIYPPESVTRLAGIPGGAEQLRAATYLQSDLSVTRLKTASTPRIVFPVAGATPAKDIMGELQTLLDSEQGRLLDYKRFTLYFAKGRCIPKTLLALGSARETTFRTAGQGTGKACDLSPEDDYYHHLILWDRDKAQLAGAYRIGMVSRILKEHGAGGLYLDHVFKINPRLYRNMGSSFELSRSFVLPDYQGDPDALAGLWKGLGAAAVRHDIETFFGSVTISNDHHPASQAILVEYLRANHPDTTTLRSWVKARNPFQPATRYHRLVADAYQGQGLQKLAPLIENIENGERGIPPLIRYYCNLGARFLNYHVEEAFGNSLYCLLRVDLATIPSAYRKLFLPKNTNL